MKTIHQTNCSEKSTIEFLPIINAKPDSFGTVYTTLIECLRRSESRPVVATFDLPLWLKTVRVVLDNDMPIIPRLGGFHLLKSFLGCIGFIMKDSGLEDVFQLIYPGSETVEKILSGASYYKALRAHFLVDAALRAVIIESEFSDDNMSLLESNMLRCRKEKLGSQYKKLFIHGVQEIIKKKLKAFALTGRTATLWFQYHDQVQLVKDYIRAERLSEFDNHM